MRVSTSVSRLLCASLSSLAALNVGDDLAPPRHRELGQFPDGLVGAFAVQQFDRLRNSIRRVPARTALKHVGEQRDSAIHRRGVLAEQGDQPRLGVEDAAEPEQLVLDIVDLALTLGAHQQSQAGDVPYSVDQVGGRTTSAARRHS